MDIAARAALGSGADFWSTKSVGEVPAITLTDGPHGVRRQRAAADHLGLNDAEPATCFPPAVALAQSWDPELVGRVAAAIGREAHALDVQVVLGPGINIKRDPRGGRNFEYYSEDPRLSGVLGTAWVRGIQGQGVGASVKHFAVNNQETDRMRISAEVDARTLREVYLPAFHRVITEARPWTVMTSYNRINGVWAAENPWLLTELLRGEWGYEGVVVSDWGAVDDRVRSVRAGLDLVMPGPDAAGDAQLVAAVDDGVLPEAALTRAAQRIETLARRARSVARPESPVDLAAHHELAREAARRSIVLLRNTDTLLPLAPADSLAVIGELARSPRYQGGGSSHVTPTRVDVPLDEITRRAGGAVRFEPGYRLDTDDDGADAEALRSAAVRAATAADTAVVFLGLAEELESEGFDRADIDLPATQLELVAAVTAAQPRTVVVLSHGGVVRLATVAAPALLDAALSGQGGGAAIADVLFGTVNPSGKLAETVPMRLQDAPSYLNFPGAADQVRHGEGLYVGYRGYDALERAVQFPFGHGLSYTDFDYRDLRLTVTDDGIEARITVANVGRRAGREVAQFYVGVPGSAVPRPPRVLAGFADAELAAGEATELVVRLTRRELAYWEVRVGDWVLEPGDYRVDVGASSRDLRASATVTLPGDVAEIPLTLQSTLGEVARNPAVLGRVLELLADAAPDWVGGAAAGQSNIAAMMGGLPVGRLTALLGGRLTRAQLQQALDGCLVEPPNPAP